MKKTKLKFAAAVAALAMTFALFTGCNPGEDATSGDTTNTTTTSTDSSNSGDSTSSTDSGNSTSTDIGTTDSTSTADPVTGKTPVVLSTGGSIKIADLEEYKGSSAKLAVVVANTVSGSSKGSWGAGGICTQNSSYDQVTDLTSTYSIKTPTSGKTKTYFWDFDTVYTSLIADSSVYFYVNAYNDASVTKIAVVWGIPDDISADLSKLTGYDSASSALKYTAESYSQYVAMFTIALSDLGCDGHNCIEIIGENYVNSSNVLEEWKNNFGAFVGSSSDIYHGTSADNMGYEGHTLSWTDSSYDTLLIQNNAEKCDTALITKINLSYVEEGTCDLK